MRKLIYSIIAILFVAQISMAGKIEVTKEYQESYSVDSQTDFKIENKFGDIIIADWEKDEISINLVIKVKSKNKERADKYLNYISSEIKKEGNSVIAITIFDKKWNNIKKVEVDIKYIIKAPAYLTYDIKNKFGNITVSKITGPTRIDLKYGNLFAKNLRFNKTNEQSNIKLSYSNADIQYCNYADIEIKYGNLKFETGKSLKLDASYSNIDIQKLEMLHFEGKYGGFNMDTVDVANIEAKYMNLDIAYISSKLGCEIKYGNLKILSTSALFSKIDIQSAYGQLKLLIHPDAVYQIVAKVENGKINLPKKVNIDRVVSEKSVEITGLIGPRKQDAKASGIVGTKNGGTKSTVNIGMKYGNLTL